MGLFSRACRAKQQHKATGPLRKVYEKPVQPKSWLAVDVETTGLDPAKDRLLSIGWVAVEGRDIVLAESGYVVVRPDEKAASSQQASVGESATLHGLTDDVIAQGIDAKEALEQFLNALAGRKLLAHYAQMELGFLSPLCQKYFGAGLEIDAADTMAREYERIVASGRVPRREELRLWSLMDKYGLPRTKAHHAYSDALACAQVWLAQRSH